MVCNGRVGGSGFKPPIRPNLNRKQEGVPGLRNALNNTDGKPPIHTTEHGGEKVYMYRGSKTSGSSAPIQAHVNEQKGSVWYSYVDRTNPSDPHTVHAFDDDNDGNIDRYTIYSSEYNQETGGYTSREITYFNPNDDGSANFQKQTNGFSWNPLNWFK